MTRLQKKDSCPHSSFFYMMARHPILFFIIAFFIFAQNIYPSPSPYTGALAGEHALKIIKTTYFDIIAGEGSEDSANKIASVADSIYDELAGLLHLRHKFRLPVTITSTVDNNNAYYSSAPYNHIVIYDTPNTLKDVVAKDHLLNTFRHELTHAITYNLHNGFWRGVEMGFSDALNPALITVTQGVAEGTAVQLESREESQGRVNSDYHMARVRQAKIEGCFPLYSEIQGVRDIEPGGVLSYYFGGAFFDYVVKKYGDEKFSRFWWKLSNWQTATYFTSFYEVYHIGIRRVWEDFQDSLKTPFITKWPEDQNYCRALTSRKSPISLDLGAISNKFYYYYDKDCDLVKSLTLDETTLSPLSEGTVINRAKHNKDPKSPYFYKGKAIFTTKGATRLSVTTGDEILSVSYTGGNYETPTTRVILITRGGTFLLPKKHLREADLGEWEGGYYLTAVRTKSQYSTLEVYRIDYKDERVRGVNLLHSFPLPYGEGVYSPVIAGGKAFFIRVANLTYTLCALDLESGEVFETPFPQGVKVYSLDKSTNGGDLTFSWTTKESLVRVGFVAVNQNNVEWKLMDCDISGGVYHPCMDEGRGCVYYIANLFDRAQVSLIDIKKVPLITTSGEAFFAIKGLSNSDNTTIASNAGDMDKDSIEGGNFNNSDIKDPKLCEIKPFSSGAYFFSHKGTFLPIAVALSMSANNSSLRKGNFNKAVTPAWLPFGVSYATSTPWTNPVVALSAGYSPFSNSFGINFLATNKAWTLTDIFSWHTYASVEFDDGAESSGSTPMKEFKQTYENINGALNLSLLHGGYLTISDTFQFFYGRQSSVDLSKYTGEVGSLKSNFDDKRIKTLFALNRATFTIGNIHSIGGGYYDKAGLQFSLRYDINYYKLYNVTDLTKIKNKRDYQNLGCDLLLKFPAGRPVTAAVSIFPNNTYFLNLGGSIVLYTWEIQKSTNFVPVFYSNRVTLSLLYSGSFECIDSNRVRILYDSRHFGFAYYKKPISNWAIKDIGDYFGRLASGDYDYYDLLSLKAAWTITPNFGGLARSNFKFDLSLEAGYRFFTDKSIPIYMAICGVALF